MRVAISSAALLTSLLIAAPVRSATESCACKHLESVQQELENAAYEAKFFADLAKRLDAIEKKQADLNKNHPEHPDSGRSVLATSANERLAIMGKEFRLPHKTVKGYTGPNSVEIEPGTCRNAQSQLDALANGSSCKEIGDITLAHEAQHRALCEQMGKDKYWARLPSAIAAEESQRYADQAKAMRNLLKKVIDGGKMRISDEMEVTTSGQGFSATYFYQTAPFDLSGKSNPSTDEWTLKGEGTKTGVIRRAALPGAQCTPYGQLNDRETATMKLDGLSMGLFVETTSKPGDVGLKCRVSKGQGWGMSMRPQGETGGGDIFRNERVRLMSEVVQDVAAMDFAKTLASGGMSATGYAKTRVELVCPAK